MAKMNRNIFKVFLNKFLAYPLWIKQVVYYRLWQNMVENNCDGYIIENYDKMFAMYIPTLTFNGKQELWDKKGGYDSNIYSFLKYVHSGYSILEIALNMFMSIEEASKLYIFCIEQNLIETGTCPEVTAMAEFIAGKISTGEYFLKNGIIDIEQLNYTLNEQRNFEDIGEHILIGTLLARFGYINDNDLKLLFKLKSDSKKRFVINPDFIPDSQTDIRIMEKLREENKKLTDENNALKKALTTIVNTVKNYDI